MLLRTIVVCSLFLTLGCGSAPKKPTIESGDIDYPRSEVIAGLSDGSDKVRRVPLKEYDKATCYKPSELEKYRVYVRLLEAFAQGKCEVKQWGN